MAQFIYAFQKTGVNEGSGWSKRVTDLGGETFRGISRVYNPQWAGWAVLDKTKDLNGVPTGWNTSEMSSLVEKFYKDEVWDKLHGDIFVSQKLAERVVDIAVNMGEDDAGRFLQRSVNAFAPASLNWTDLLVDGDIGLKTVGALNILLKTDMRAEAYIMEALVAQQKTHFVHRAAGNFRDRANIRGWFNRANA